MNQHSSSEAVVQRIAHLLATWFYSGLSPKAPGTAGSLAALPFAAAIHYALGPTALFYAALILFVTGTWATRKYLEATGKDDPGEVVVDEVAAMWLMLSMLPFTWQWYALAFVVFRVLDAGKPWPVSWADRTIKGPFGVMFDDIVAAVMGLVFWAAFNWYCITSNNIQWLMDFNTLMGS